MVTESSPGRKIALAVGFDTTVPILAEFFQTLHDFDGDRESIVRYLDEFDIDDFLDTFEGGRIPAELRRRRNVVIVYQETLVRLLRDNPEVTPSFPNQRTMSIKSLLEVFQAGSWKLDNGFVRNCFLEVKTTHQEAFEWGTFYNFDLMRMNRWESNEIDARVSVKLMALVPSLYIASLHGQIRGFRSEMFSYMNGKNLKTIEAYLDKSIPYINNINTFKSSCLSKDEFTLQRVKLHAEYVEYLEAKGKSVNELTLMAIASLIKPDDYESIERFWNGGERFLSRTEIADWSYRGFTDFDYISQWVDAGLNASQAEKWYDRGIHYPDEAKEMNDLTPNEWTDKW